MKPIVPTLISVLCLASGHLGAAVQVDGVNTNTDAAYDSFASSTDLVNAGASTFSSVAYSANPHFGGTSSTGGANNNGTVGTANNTPSITFWLNAVAGSTYSITYALNTSVNTLGYDINSIQTIHGWTNNSGNQKNQNYVVAVSTVGSATFTNIATVAYLPFTSAGNTASTKVLITEDVTNILASGVDEIRFTYTVPASAGQNPSPTIREIDVFGTPTATGNNFSDWIGGFSGLGGLTGLGDDPDGDGTDNGVENFFGTAPNTFTQGLISGAVSGGTFTFTHPQNATPAADLTAAYRWSKDLQTFHADGATDVDATKVDFTTQLNTPPGITTVTATVTGTATTKLFVDVEVTQN